MTYRKKLLLKKILRTSAIVAAAIFIVLLLGFSYLSRYLVYTEDGAHFSFNSVNSTTEEQLTKSSGAPASPVLVTGDNIERPEEDDEATNTLAPGDIEGVLIDYATLSSGTDLSTIDFSDYNTLMLEMRTNGSDILSTTPVKELITRAQDQGIHLIALISCLDDSEYALANAADALQISGGALWATDSGSYYLDPSSENVQKYVASMIETLGGMGFYDIVLNNFLFPYSTSINYDSDSIVRDQALITAYDNICNLVGDTYSLGILISDPDTGHQLSDTATHLYVYFSSGSDVETYASEHESAYLVFLTNSHDTRFDAYGKINTEITFSDQVTASDGETADDAVEGDAADTADTTDEDTETTDNTENADDAAALG